ncbi:hypothetical protein, partial [Microcoleus sp. herbarium12]|uniref:hypothetical protein n=1 Tax=Microcoleus sp. herbarium12 TaxID=3055437 RepID=UPI002FD45B5C
PTGVENPCLIAKVLSKRTGIDAAFRQFFQSVLTDFRSLGGGLNPAVEKAEVLSKRTGIDADFRQFFQSVLTDFRSLGGGLNPRWNRGIANRSNCGKIK